MPEDQLSELKRIPPNNIPAERSVLGSMMLDERAVAEAVNVLKEKSFYVPAHRLVFSAITSLFEAQKPIDIISVATSLQAQNSLEKVGGEEYLAQLTESVPTTANIEHYARIVQDKWLVRELILASQNIVADCYRGELETKALLGNAEKKVFDIAQSGTKGDFAKISDMMLDTIEYLEELSKKTGSVTGVDTGFAQLNDFTTGLHGGELIIIAARPAMGKTAFALNLAENVAIKDNRGVAVFSMEMTARQLLLRILSSHAGVEGQKLRRGDLSQRDWTAFMQAGTVFKKAKIFIDASPQLTPLDVRARCRRLKADNPDLGLVIIDYIQLMDANAKGVDGRQQEVAYISRSLKAMAMELDLPVVALSQLNRDSEKGKEKGARPQLSQLRESGAIEQDADVVMLLYRPAYYSEDPKFENYAEVILAKQRNGPTGTVKLNFFNKFARFEDPAPGAFDGFDED